MRLTDTVALVTGGGSGIGRAIAERFAREGARVVVADRDLPGAEETVARVAGAGGAALAVEVDVSGAEAVERMAREATTAYGRVDVLVNNAGLSLGDGVLDIDEATWDFNLAVVLKGTFLCSRAVLPGMVGRRRGAIVNIASVNGLTALGEEAYSAAKAGVINLTRNLAVRHGPDGVRANAICPGTIRTPIWGPLLERDPGLLDRLAAWYPLRRVGEPEDVANAALFLASEEAGWMTGATLLLDGGLLAGIEGIGRETAPSAAPTPAPAPGAGPL